MILFRVIAVVVLVMCSAVASGAQGVLRFTDGNHAIPYVSVLDTGIRFYRSADSTGTLSLPTGEYHLVINHVSFEYKYVSVNIPDGDTAIEIALAPRSVNLNEVRVKSAKPHPRKNIRDFGNAYKKSRSSSRIPMDVRVGMIFRPAMEGRPRYLNSVKFRLKNIVDLKRIHDNMEIRIYKMNGKTIEDEPANLKPIYLPLDKVKTFNNVRVDETIEIPADGVFVSLELPAVSEERLEYSMTFVMTLYHEECNEYHGKVSNTIWNSQTFPRFKSCFPDLMGHKNAQLSIGISYYE